MATAGSVLSARLQCDVFSQHALCTRRVSYCEGGEEGGEEGCEGMSVGGWGGGSFLSLL
jgi:hypothetical protein